MVAVTTDIKVAFANFVNIKATAATNTAKNLVATGRR